MLPHYTFTFLDALRNQRWRESLGSLHVRHHLYCAETELRLVDTSALPAELRRARACNLDALRAYRQAAVFPRNTHAPGRIAPVFIDSEGRRCAVAHLMSESGAGATAAKIAEQSNLARIREMDAATLAEWVPESGLTAREVARIQPAYCSLISDAQSVAQQLYWLPMLLGAVIQVFMINCALLLARWVPGVPGAWAVDWVRRDGWLLALAQWALYAIGIALIVVVSPVHDQLLNSLIVCVGENVGIDTAGERARLVRQLQQSIPWFDGRAVDSLPALLWFSIAIVAIELFLTWYRHFRERVVLSMPHADRD